MELKVSKGTNSSPPNGHCDSGRMDGITRDITERAPTEEGVRRDTQLYSRLVNSLDCILWEADARTFEFSFVSPQAERMLGYPVEQWLSPGFWAQHVHPEDVEWCTKFCIQATQRGQDHEFEYRMIAADGRTVWLHDVVSVQTAPHGPERLTGMMIDVTSRKVAEELLRESEERFRAIFENAGLGTSLVDRQGHPIKCNPAIQKMLGFTEQELRSMAFTEFTHPDDIDLDWRLYSELVDGKRDKYEVEKRYFKKDGQLIWGHLTVSRVKNKDGVPSDYTVGMVEDITERKRAERELKAAHDQLTKELAERTHAEAEIVRLSVSLINAQEEERTRIARELHDDVSQQIAGLGIALSNIKRQIPEDRREAREQAERAYDRVLAIGEGIRHLSHQLHPAILEHSGLVAALESYCTEFESLTKVNATVQAEGLFDDLSANATLGIFRIAQEALQNVWKHSRVRGAVICLARAREHMRLQISDRGIGFDPAQPSKEAGLGLVSMRERARLLGGTLTVESSAGQGTTIIVDIPVNPSPPAKASD
jgi:PAS domain S-box-containing protein